MLLEDSEKKNMLVSVVIPCYNYGKFIEEAVDSVLASTYHNVEIIIVDDGPTDPFTINLLRSFKKPKTKIIFQKNMGLAMARNNGISQAKGTFILPLDADDKIDPTYIEKALYVLEKNPRLGLAYGYVKVFGSQDMLWKTGEYSVINLLKENIIPSCSLFRKKFWEKVGGYEKDRYQYDDWTFWLKLAEGGFLGKLIPEVLFFHRKHLGQENMTDRLREKHAEYYGKIRRRFSGLFRKKNLLLLLFFKKFSVLLHIILPRIVSKRLFWLKGFFIKLFFKDNFVQDISRIGKYRIATQKKDKLLIFLPWIIRGGVEKVTLDIIRKMTDFEVFLITTIKKEYDYKVDLEFKKITKNVYHLPNFLKEEDYFYFIQNLIEKNDIKNILINHCAWAYERAEKLREIFPELKIFDLLHNTSEDGFKNYSKKYYKSIKKTVAISQEIKINLIEHLNFSDDRVDVILNGVDSDETFNIGKIDRAKVEKEFVFPKGKIKIFFIGRLSVEKRPLKFIEIAKALESRFPEKYFFVMAGTGDLLEKVMVEVKNNFNKEQFAYLGDCSQPEEVLSLVDVMMNTSEIEGMPLTVLEALAMDVPVIVPDIGGIREVVKDGYNGLLLNKDPQVDDYIEAIEKLTVEDFYSKIKKNTRRSVETFSVVEMAKKYKKLFQND